MKESRYTRRERRAIARQERFWRVVPMFEGKAGELIDGAQTYVLHTDVKDLLVVTLPSDSVSVAFAQSTEQELMRKTGRDVIVTSPNVRFFRTERLTPQEVASLIPKEKPAERLAVPEPSVPEKVEGGPA